VAPPGEATVLATIDPTFGASIELAEERYTVKGELGRGGGGLVLEVVDAHLEREVALKVMHASEAGDEQAALRLIREARLTAQLEHPAILPIYELAQRDDGRFYFCMRKSSGRTLSQLIRAAASGETVKAITTAADRVDVMVRVCDAMAYAHSRGIVHRDIKPANIMLGDFGEVTVLDWGTASDPRVALPEAGVFVGTPLYASPEQARGESVDERSDVYCLGATLWHLIALRRPEVVPLDHPEFWERKLRGELPEAPAGVPEGLLRIARRAMEPDRVNRYQSVVELREDLRAWQHHQTSIGLCARATRALQELDDSFDYASFARVCDGFSAALEEWAGNEEARAGLSKARAAYARFALSRADLELCAETLDPDDPAHDELRAELASARTKAARVRRRGLWLRLAATALVLLGLGAAGLLVLEQKRAVGAWHLIWQLEPSAELVTMLEPAYPMTSIAPLILDGALSLPQSELFFLPDVGAKGNVRLEAEVEWVEEANGFEILLKSGRERPPKPWQMPAGYYFQFGGLYGLSTSISEHRVGGVPKPHAGIPTRFTGKRRYRLSVAFRDGAATLSIDGKEQLRVESVLPLGNAEHRHVAIRSWGNLRIHGMRLYRQALPEKPTPLVAGDTLAAEGMYRAAARVYRDVAEDFRGTPLAEEALARAYMAAALAPDMVEEQRLLLERLLTAYPQSRHRRRCEETAALVLWRAQELDRALDQAASIVDRYPASRIALSLLDERPRPLARGPARRLLELVRRAQGVSRLDLGGMDLGDLTPLRGLPLVELLASNTNIESLSPLKGLPLRRLDVSFSAIADLEALRGMPLEVLAISGTRVRDLAPLEGAPLSELRMVDTPVSDLTPLSASRLRQLRCGYSAITSLTPLRGLPLEHLEMPGLGIADLTPLANAPLTYLDATGNQIRDLAPLRRSSSSRWRTLRLRSNAIENLEPLKGARGDQLDLIDNRIRDLSPLANAQFADIRLAGNGPLALGPLASLPLHSLDLRDLPPLSLAPLARSKVTSLALTRTRVSDPEVLLELPELTSLELVDAVPAEKLEQLCAELAALGRARALVQSCKVQAALALRDGAKLRAHSTLANETNQRLLFVPLQLEAGAARKLASELGATLPVLSHPALKKVAIESASDFAGFWIDLSYRAPDLVWPDGTKAARHDVALAAFSTPGKATGFTAYRIGDTLEWLMVPPGTRWAKAYLALMWSE
jgi:hypothetical protein